MVSAEIAQNQKWHLFFEKGVFDMGEKVGFTNFVFEMLCFAENTIFIVFSAKHSFSKAKIVRKKKQEIYEKWWVVFVFEHGKMVFFGFVFWGFNVIVVCFWCVWHSSRSVKNDCFSKFWGLLWGGLFFFILGLEGLGVFVFLVFVFVFCVVFVSVLFALFLLLDCFWCWSLFCFSFCFLFLFFLVLVFCFCSWFCFGGFKGQVRWPKGPPHLALDPPYFFIVF